MARLCILGHGLTPIPPPGRGAVETVIWQYREGLVARGHTVGILNVRPAKVWTHLPRLVRADGPFDWVWSHHERSVAPCLFWARAFGFKVLETTHRPLPPGGPSDGYSALMFRRAARAPYHAVLSEPLGALYRQLNPRSKVLLLPNGAEVGRFAFREQGNGRAVCVGGVSPRKRQAVVAKALAGHAECDFVGPLDRSDPEVSWLAAQPEYRGEWTREEMFARLTDYSCLVLFSLAEGHALVVMEAMAAGLSVVVSPACTTNLDTTLPWIHVAETEAELQAAVRRAIDENPLHRAAVRRYAQEHLGWDDRVARLEAQLAVWSEPA
jgi:glycosyltransferase involved in cell wall biosynthesis